MGSVVALCISYQVLVTKKSLLTSSQKGSQTCGAIFSLMLHLYDRSLAMTSEKEMIDGHC